MKPFSGLLFFAETRTKNFFQYCGMFPKNSILLIVVDKTEYCLL